MPGTPLESRSSSQSRTRRSRVVAESGRRSPMEPRVNEVRAGGRRMLQCTFRAALWALLVAGCEKVEPPRGPGLPACKRDPASTGCTVIWSGSDSGSSSCSVFVTASSASGPWQWWLNGGSTPSLSAGVGLASTPSAGQTVTLDQTANGGITPTPNHSTSWVVNRERPTLVDPLLLVDGVIPGSPHTHVRPAGPPVP